MCHNAARAYHYEGEVDSMLGHFCGMLGRICGSESASPEGPLLERPGSIKWCRVEFRLRWDHPPNRIGWLLARGAWHTNPVPEVQPEPGQPATTS